MMKKQHSFLWALVLCLMGIPFMLTSCQKGSSLSALDGSEPSSPRTIVINEGTAKDSVHIEFDVPDLSDQRINESIMEQLNEALGGLYESDYADADSMARFYARYYMDDMAEMRSDFDAEMGFEHSVSVKRSYETTKLITFDVLCYQYSGGAHGGCTYLGLTFRKSDGRRMGNDVLRSTDDVEWGNTIKEGLMEYFEVKTEEELQDCLLDVETYMLPLPQAEPSFQENGLLFTYQQYEIAPYAAGMPSFVIPYDKVNKYLNVTGRRLLAEE